MKQNLKAEFRKLLSVRSTYILTGLALLFVVLTDFITGWKTHSSNFNPNSFDSHAYIQALFAAASIAGTFMAILGILITAHEYRYRTIVYALTNSNSRTRVIFAKLIVMTIFAAIVGIVVMLTGLEAFIVGVATQGVRLPHQEINILETTARCLLFIISYAGVGIIFGALIRNLVGAIAVLFIVPGTVEALVGLLFKGKNQFLPFTSIKQLIIDPGQIPKNIKFIETNHPFRSALTFLAYFVVAWAITWYLFVRRDALND